VLTHTLHYGLGAFEGIRAYRRDDGRTSIFRLDEHLQRLLDTCRLVCLEPRFDRAQLASACAELLRANALEEAYLRPIVYVGEGAMGIFAPDNPVQTAVVAWRWGTYLGERALEDGVRARVSSWRRHHPGTSLPRGKIIGQYINSALAKREVKMAGYDEAILLDLNGHVCEGSGENIFVVKDGVLTTPPLSSSILQGITRDTIITLAREDGHVVQERNITRDQLYLADEAFFTGTAVEVTPVREVDDRPIGAGGRGEITARLQARYFDIVKGKDDKSHPEWLSFV
jgi:branched-chain amino acid aminotransferase